ncbi:MAG TPA: tetratricopeptide repeat protein [Polyangiaceae bacterium]
MKEPRRLLQGAADEFERELLASSEVDVPSSRAYQRTVASLGVGLMLPLGAAGVAQGAVAAPAAKLGVTVLAKWLASGALLGVVTASGAQLTSRALGQRSVAPPPAVSVQFAGTPTPEVAVSAVEPPAVAPAPAPVPSIETSPEQPARAAKAPEPQAEPPAPSSAPPVEPVSSPAPAPSLALEMQRLEAARRTLAQGDARAALAGLEKYALEFPNGALSPEARVLEVSALLQSGQREQALEVGRRVIERDPDGPHAEAVRARLSESKKP